MNDDGRDWLNKFYRLNGLDDNGQWQELLSKTPRKPARLAQILGSDKYALIVTNRRAARGIKQTRFTR